MRLVDADAFIEWFKRTYDLERVDEDNGETTLINTWILSVDIVDDIENFKTAYDVEKVVKELEKSRHIDRSCGDVDYSIYESEAIEIVRKGGVE